MRRPGYQPFDPAMIGNIHVPPFSGTAWSGAPRFRAPAPSYPLRVLKDAAKPDPKFINHCNTPFPFFFQ
jgi:hypothetical protein